MRRWAAQPRRVGTTPAHLLYVLLDAAVDEYFPVLDSLEDRADALMETIMEAHAGMLSDSLAVKRELLAIRRALGPLRDVVNALLRRDLDFIPPDLQPYYSDLLDHVLRLNELTEMHRDAVNSLIDVYLAATSNRLNEIMKKMTVIATVLMTMALVAGIYGMNFDFMPELHWAFGYPFALALMGGSGFLVIVFFRRKGWL
jgi:magnesium transporter